MNAEQLYYLISGVVAVASAYGSLRSRVSAVERRLAKLVSTQEKTNAELAALRALLPPLRVPGPPGS